METNTSTSINTSFIEGQSTARPPLFNGMNYNYWATRMRIYMQANGFDSWNITQTECAIPIEEYSTWSNTHKLDATANAKAMNMLFCALDKNEFNRVSMCNTAYEIWRTLKVTHEGLTRSNKAKYPYSKVSFKTLG